jgi:hypothetical protein
MLKIKSQRKRTVLQVSSTEWLFAQSTCSTGGVSRILLFGPVRVLSFNSKLLYHEVSASIREETLVASL